MTPNVAGIYHPDTNGTDDTIVIYWGQDSAGNYIERIWRIIAI